MKRSDLTTEVVLTAIREHGMKAWDILTETYPPKVVLAAFRRDTDRRLLECGVAEERPWIIGEEPGRDKLLSDSVLMHFIDLGASGGSYDFQRTILNEWKIGSETRSTSSLDS